MLRIYAQNKKKLTKDVRLVSTPWVLKRNEWWALFFAVREIFIFRGSTFGFFFSKIQIELLKETQKTLLDYEKNMAQKKT